jgi:signal transduction histidine kinase/ActR/RegA family two-component response regulator
MPTRILVVDDDEDFADSLVKWIGQQTNWQAEYVLGADEAESRLRSGRFDALILDRNLSDKSGLPGRWGDELFRDLRCETAFDGLAVMVLTGYGTAQNSADMVRAGVFQYLTKPLPLETLPPTIIAAIAWQRSNALCHALPARDISPADVLDEIGKIIGAIELPGAYTPQLIPVATMPQESEGESSFIHALRSGRKALLVTGKDQVSQRSPINPGAESLVAGRVLGPDGLIAAVLDIESSDPKAFDPVWLSVIECFADAMSMSYKLENLKLQVKEQERKRLQQVKEQEWKSLQEAAAEFRHAFNGRLQVMKEHAERIASVDSSALDGESRDRLRDSSASITSNIARLSTYVKRASAFGDSPKLNKMPVHLDTLVAGCWASLKKRAADLAVRFNAETSLAVVEADEEMIEESLFCLLSNALDAIADRQYAAGQPDKEDVIGVTIRSADSHVEISICDTGIGFDLAAKEKLFLPFYTTKTDRPPGDVPSPHQGIGLFTVQRIMQMHGGEVKAESRGHYEGATFTIRIPVHG